ncbi:hypothetical protein ACWGQ5_50965 [Streptomyces sp. NPDC055722]
MPFAEAMAPGVRAAVESVRPEVVVADQQAFAGALVAERLGVPWTTSAITSAELVDPLAGLPRVKEHLDGLLTDLPTAPNSPNARDEWSAATAAASPAWHRSSPPATTW